MRKAILLVVVLMFLVVLVVNGYQLVRLVASGAPDPASIIRFLFFFDVIFMTLIYVGFKFVKRKTKT